ncbi:MAG: FG-GAP repeat protein [Thermomicrobiales bacterium]
MSGGGWHQQTELTPTDGAMYDSFGYSVATTVDGSAAFVGAKGKNGKIGAVYLFTRSGALWSQQGTVTGSTSVVNDEFGSSVGISGDGTFAAVGASQKNTQTGTAYVFGPQSGPPLPTPKPPGAPSGNTPPSVPAMRPPGPPAGSAPNPIPQPRP